MTWVIPRFQGLRSQQVDDDLSDQGWVRTFVPPLIALDVFWILVREEAEEGSKRKSK
jgi:hypothetical protein